MALFKKTKSIKEYAFPGIPKAIDGVSAGLQTELLSEATVGVISNQKELGLTNNQQSKIKEVDTPHDLVGLIQGLSLTGQRASGVLRGSELVDVHRFLSSAVNNQCSFVINHLCGRIAKQKNSYDYGHDDFYATQDTGLFMLFATNVQEVIDFGLIAHRIAELILTPGICAQDFDATGLSIQAAKLPEPELVKKYLGQAGDLISSPTEAQKIVFGNKRNRVPQLFDVDRSLGMGAIHSDTRLKNQAAQDFFFKNNIVEVVEKAMREFGNLTGRFYGRVSGYKIKDAEYVVISQGSVCEDLKTVVDYLRKSKKIKAGFLNVSIMRPFPGDLISIILQGKKAVTVLEKVNQPLSDDLPMLKDIRGALDKAIENGVGSKEKPAYPSYARYEKLTDRPNIFSGVYGVDAANPSYSQLASVFLNMVSGSEEKKSFYVGIDFKQTDLRLPELERLQQRINKYYPDLQSYSLTEDKSIQIKQDNIREFQFVNPSDSFTQKGFRFFTQAVFETQKCQVKTTSQLVQFRGQQNQISKLRFTVDLSNPDLNELKDVLVVSHFAQLQNPSILSRLSKNVVVFVYSESNPKQLWQQIGAEARTKIQDNQIRLYAVKPSVYSVDLPQNQVIWHLTLGALLKIYPLFDSSKKIDHVIKSYCSLLETELDLNKNQLKKYYDLITTGTKTVKEINWSKMPAVKEQPVLETEAPWTVRQTKQLDGSIYDPVRFWESVGYLYASGQEDKASIDPYLGSGMIPARSTIPGKLDQVRTHFPRWIQENCTTCGECWMQCPESALPITIQGLDSLVRTVLQQVEANGNELLQLTRMKVHLVKQAYRFFLNDELNTYLNLGDLLKDAFTNLIDLTKPKEDQQKVLEHEFKMVREMVATFPIAKTDTFFTKANQKEKGSGQLFSMVVNPETCTGCNVCVQVCPEEALESVKQTSDLLSSYGSNWNFLRKLPDAPQNRIQEFMTDDQPETLAYQFLNSKVYHTILGGFDSSIGEGQRIAIHTFAGMVEAIMQPRYAALVEKLSDLINRLQDKIQGKVTGTFQINDFELFGKKLSDLESKTVDGQALSSLIEGEESESINKDELARMTEVHDRLKSLYDFYREGPTGDGRARMAMSISSGDLTYPNNPFAFPVIVQPTDNISCVEGLSQGMIQKMTEEFKFIRIAELMVDDTYNPVEHNPFFERFNWKNFSDEEIKICPPLIVLLENEFEKIPHLLKKDWPFIKILLINSLGHGLQGMEQKVEGYSGVRRKEPGLWAIAHRNAFVLQSSTGKMEHLMNGIDLGMKYNGPALFHIYASDSLHHGIETIEVSNQARLVVESRAFPAFTFTPSKPGEKPSLLDLEGNPAIEDDWYVRTTNIKYQNGMEFTLQTPFTFADWALKEDRFRNLFTRLAKKEWENTQTPIHEFLTVDKHERAQYQPYIEEINADGTITRALLSDQMVTETEDRLALWHVLQEYASVNTELANWISEKVKQDVEKELEQVKQEVSFQYEARISQLQSEHGKIYHEKLTQKLLAMSGYGRDSEKLLKSLHELVKNNQAEDGD